MDHRTSVCLALILISTALPLTCAQSKNLSQGVDQILDKLARELDSAGIDVSARRPTPPSLPSAVLRPSSPNVLREMHPKALPTYRWMNAFEHGYADTTAAVKGPVGEGKLNSDAFLSRWERASPEDRVFISYTKADNQLAQHLANALERHGYVTFTYLNEQGKLKYSAAEVGRRYREASHHYFLDTPRYRTSAGGWFEIRHEVPPISRDNEKPIKKRGPRSSVDIDRPKTGGLPRELPVPEQSRGNLADPVLVMELSQREMALRVYLELSIYDRKRRKAYLDWLSEWSRIKHLDARNALKRLERFETAIPGAHRLRSPTYRKRFIERFYKCPHLRGYYR